MPAQYLQKSAPQSAAAASGAAATAAAPEVPAIDRKCRSVAAEVAADRNCRSTHNSGGGLNDGIHFPTPRQPVRNHPS
jgi:hypothetical protein